MFNRLRNLWRWIIEYEDRCIERNLKASIRHDTIQAAYLAIAEGKEPDWRDLVLCTDVQVVNDIFEEWRAQPYHFRLVSFRVHGIEQVTLN